MTTEAKSRTRRRAERLLGFYADTRENDRPDVDQQSELDELLDCIVELAAKKAKKDLREE
jgi:hypothetical protein